MKNSNVEEFKNYDCAGFATRYGVECSDGRVIEHGAFKHLDGVVVPLVYAHQRTAPDNLIGKALLQETEEGVRAYTLFNSTKSGQHMKACVEHGDLDSYSIFATNLRERGLFVKRGDIKEVSLVISGANPQARIDQIAFSHDDADDGEAICYSGDLLDETMGGEFEHADTTKDEEPKTNDSKSKDDKTIAAIYNRAMNKLSEEELQIIMLVFGEMINSQNQNENTKKTVEQSEITESTEEDETMKKNVFESQANGVNAMNEC